MTPLRQTGHVTIKQVFITNARITWCEGSSQQVCHWSNTSRDSIVSYELSRFTLQVEHLRPASMSRMFPKYFQRQCTYTNSCVTWYEGHSQHGSLGQHQQGQHIVIRVDLPCKSNMVDLQALLECFLNTSNARYLVRYTFRNTPRYIDSIRLAIHAQGSGPHALRASIDHLPVTPLVTPAFHSLSIRHTSSPDRKYDLT